MDSSSPKDPIRIRLSVCPDGYVREHGSCFEGWALTAEGVTRRYGEGRTRGVRKPGEKAKGIHNPQSDLGFPATPRLCVSASQCLPIPESIVFKGSDNERSPVV